MQRGKQRLFDHLVGAAAPSRSRLRPSAALAEVLRKWQARFNACRFPGRQNAPPSGDATGQWDVHRSGKGARLSAVVASRSASSPTPPAVRRPSGRATGSCYPSLRRRALSSSKSRRLWILVAGSKRRASCPRGVQPKGCRASIQGRVPGHFPTHEVAVSGALFVRALAKRGVGDVTGMQEGQFADLRRVEGATLALSGAGRLACHMK